MFARTVGPKGSSYRGGPPGDATAELRRVNAVRSAGRVDSAADDCEAKLDVFAMATGGLGGDDPVSIAGRRNCGRSPSERWRRTAVFSAYEVLVTRTDSERVRRALGPEPYQAFLNLALALTRSVVSKPSLKNP